MKVLQRYVYRGAPPPVPGPVGASLKIFFVFLPGPFSLGCMESYSNHGNIMGARVQTRGKDCFNQPEPKSSGETSGPDPGNLHGR